MGGEGLAPLHTFVKESYLPEREKDSIFQSPGNNQVGVPV